MAKKKPKKLEQIGQERKRAGGQVSSSQALLRARSFKPFDFLAARLALKEIVIEVNEDAEISYDSKRGLVELAQRILGGNVVSRQSKISDVAWVQASWAHPEADNLDPITTFEVGVAVARNKRPWEECERAARFLKFKNPGELPEGLSMIPNENGEHINVPFLGILLKSDLVDVRRNKKTVGTCSIWHALIGFEPGQREAFARPTEHEKRVLRAKRRAGEEERVRADKEAAVRKEEEKKKEEQEDLFADAWVSWELEELERIREEKSQKWVEFCGSHATLKKEWGLAMDRSNQVYEEDRPLLEALQMVCRPEPAGLTDLKKVLPLVRDHIIRTGEEVKERWEALQGFYVSRDTADLTIRKSLELADNKMPWLLPEWFVKDESGVSVLYPLRGLEKYTREQWVERVLKDPVLEEKTKEELFSLAGEE
jgi:hypothetical protein